MANGCEGLGFGAHGRGDGCGLAMSGLPALSRLVTNSARRSGRKADFPPPRVSARNCAMIFLEVLNHMYTTRPLFSRSPVANYREIIKSRLKHWRKLCNLSQAQAARLAGVARSTWQAWEDPARDALPDVAALAAVADGCRIEPGAALEWLVTEHEHRAQETAPAAASVIGGGGLRIEANGF